MTDLIIMRGFSGSGKTTAARDYVQEESTKRVRVNRDDIRAMVRGNKAKTMFGFEGEQFVTALEEQVVLAAWEQGKSVIVDDTNLRLRFARRWAELAERNSKSWVVLDVNTPVEACLEQNASGPVEEQVPPGVIRNQAERFPQPWPAVVPKAGREESGVKIEPYDHLADAHLPEAFIFDIDGTLALNKGGRSFYDESRVLEDEPNYAVFDVLAALRRQGYKIVIMSGRTQGCRHLTLSWLYMHLGADMFDALHMRAEGDGRPDYIVKGELFDKHVRHNYSVAGVYDDRNSVVRMWRQMGLQVYQVAENDA